MHDVDALIELASQRTGRLAVAVMDEDGKPHFPSFAVRDACPPYRRDPSRGGLGGGNLGAVAPVPRTCRRKRQFLGRAQHRLLSDLRMFDAATFPRPLAVRETLVLSEELLIILLAVSMELRASGGSIVL
jgi:hypothetical protein